MGLATRILVASALVVPSATVRLANETAPAPAEEAEWTAVMTEFAGAFDALEKGLEIGEADGARAPAEALAKAARRLPSISFPRAPDELVASLATRLEGLVSETARLAEQGRHEGALQAFGELRSACVSCHVRLRSEAEQRALYPARRGTVAGRVSVVDIAGDPVGDRSSVLVFLEPHEAPAQPWVNHRDPPRVGQVGHRFEPSVLPIVAGTTVEFPNDDTVFHNVFSLSRTNPFDLGIYRQGESREVRFDLPGLVKVYCNIHPEMKAMVVVLANPHFTLCAGDGFFAIDDVPGGAYGLRLWTEYGGEQRLAVTVTEGEVLEVELSIAEDRGPVPHRNKFGREYPSKY